MTDNMKIEIKANNINNIKNSITAHLIDPILDNIAKLGEDLIIEERN